MVMPKKIFAISLIILTLLNTEAHARFQTPLIMKQPPSFHHPQTVENTELSSQPYPYQQQMRYLLGERLYMYLLESDDFLRLQDLTANIIGKSYPISHPRRHY
jgi:hypothetical protein